MSKWIIILSLVFLQTSFAEELPELTDDSEEIENTLNELDEAQDNINFEEDETTAEKELDEELEDEAIPSPATISKPKKTVQRKKRRRSYRNQNVLIPSDLNDPDQKYIRKKRKIKHPLSKKGLYRITKDLDYLYKTKASEQTKSASLRFGSYEPTELESVEGKPFSDFYDSTGFIAMFDYEWSKLLFNFFDVKLGSGLFFAEGNGQFKNTPNETPLEKFTLIMMPNSLSLGYKLKIYDQQWLVPFVDGGLDVFTIMESRDDDKGPFFGASYGAHVAFGGAFSLNFLDDWAATMIDSEYGVNHIWLTAELRNYFQIGGDFDFSGSFFNIGFAFDF